MWYLSNGPQREKTFLLGFANNKGAATQTDQRLCYLLIGKYHIKTCYKQYFTILASLCS